MERLVDGMAKVTVVDCGGATFKPTLSLPSTAAGKVVQVMGIFFLLVLFCLQCSPSYSPGKVVCSTFCLLPLALIGRGAGQASFEVSGRAGQRKKLEASAPLCSVELFFFSFSLNLSKDLSTRY
jgi:hypothetical protein